MHSLPSLIAHIPHNCGGLSARTEDAALRQIEAAGGVTTSVVSLVTAMAPDFAQEPGRNTFAALTSFKVSVSDPSK
jgi:hypothetical protein